MATTEQSYRNHAHRPVAFGLVWLAALAGVLITLWVAWRDPSLASAGLVVLGIAVLGTITLLRVFALRLQDRIIRLEMRVRLARFGRDEIVDRLSLKHVVALRFASDSELPVLADRALAEQLSPDQIKRAITEWQADHFRT